MPEEIVQAPMLISVELAVWKPRQFIRASETALAKVIMNNRASGIHREDCRDQISLLPTTILTEIDEG